LGVHVLVGEVLRDLTVDSEPIIPLPLQFWPRLYYSPFTHWPWRQSLGLLHLRL
jgi:hypothetical protein